MLIQLQLASAFGFGYAAWLGLMDLRAASVRELSQELFEGYFSRVACGLHCVIKDRRARYRTLSTGPINLPFPWFRRRCVVLNDDQEVHSSEENVHGFVV